eukprot:TRINITY_DN11013_c0_g1_i1.p1 TRINITY_DN11013_c0_g1~~TRINITY_DN11013_c0_g1_i1.p1  ORF type:complete len:125 (+),score=30.60 TRINITY_DN11013_c0_g1_i1:221-595(+)
MNQVLWVALLLLGFVLFVFLLFHEDVIASTKGHISLGYGVVLGLFLLYAPSPQQKEDERMYVMSRVEVVAEGEGEEKEDDDEKKGNRPQVIVAPDYASTPSSMLKKNSGPRCPFMAVGDDPKED